MSYRSFYNYYMQGYFPPKRITPGKGGKDIQGPRLEYELDDVYRIAIFQQLKDAGLGGSAKDIHASLYSEPELLDNSFLIVEDSNNIFPVYEEELLWISTRRDGWLINVENIKKTIGLMI